jgi:hypothetical protein
MCGTIAPQGCDLCVKPCSPKPVARSPYSRCAIPNLAWLSGVPSYVYREIRLAATSDEPAVLVANDGLLVCLSLAGRRCILSLIYAFKNPHSHR